MRSSVFKRKLEKRSKIKLTCSCLFLYVSIKIRQQIAKYLHSLFSSKFVWISIRQCYQNRAAHQL